MSFALLQASAGIVETDSLIDYDDRLDDQPVFIGRAPAGTPTTGRWVVEKVTYDDEDRPTGKQTRKGAWDDRASLGWS